MQLSRHIDLVLSGFSTAQGAVEVDTQGCEGVLFVGVPGTTAARVWSMALKAGATTTGFVNCASTHTHTSTAAGNNIIAIDVHKPAKRFLGATLSSTTATPSYTLAFKYGLRKDVSDWSATDLPVSPSGIKRVVSPTSAT